MSKIDQVKVVRARAKAFTDHPSCWCSFLVYPDGEVLVYDSVANHYTTMHVLTVGAQKRIRKLAL